LSLSSSSVINIAEAIINKNIGLNKNIVAILCDNSDKYHSKLFNKEFLKKKLPIPKLL